MTGVALAVEVAGCPTICMHCWAQGTRYREMPLEDARWLVDELRRFAAGRGIDLRPYPMHEVLAHSDAAEMIRLFTPVARPEFEPFATTGVPVGTRDDWEELVRAVAEAGATTAWVALHGPPDEHDRHAGRAGAFEETRVGVERLRRGGLRVGGNVFVTATNARRFDEFAAALGLLDLDELAIAPASFCPTRRGRRYGHTHPRLEDLEPIAERVGELTSFHRDDWRELEARTERRYFHDARAGRWPASGDGQVDLVVRPNLDLHSGIAGAYGPRHGNLRHDGVDAVVSRALDYPPVTADDALLPGLEIPPLTQLASQFGDPEGCEIHFWHGSMRNRWLDRAAQGAQ